MTKGTDFREKLISDIGTRLGLLVGPYLSFFTILNLSVLPYVQGCNCWPPGVVQMSGGGGHRVPHTHMPGAQYRSKWKVCVHFSVLSPQSLSK